MSGVARTLKEAARLTSATKSLILRSSEDLVCMNLMCPKVGEACVCRLAVTVSRLPGLRELDIANNDLGMLPESVFELPALEQLDISGNRLKTLPPGIGALTSLRTLRMSNNLVETLPSEIEQLGLLEELHVGGNSGLAQEDFSKLLRRRPTLRIFADEG